MNDNETKENVVAQDQTPAKESKSVAELAKALKEQRENSVSKEEYAKLEKENADLMRAVIDGSTVRRESETPDKPADLKKLANDLTEGGIGNLEYAKRSLKFREEYIKKYEKDPFAPNNDKMTEEDAVAAQKVADALQECVDGANGSESMFNALLDEKTKNDSPAVIAMLKKKGLY